MFLTLRGTNLAQEESYGIGNKSYNDKAEDGYRLVTALLHFPVSDVECIHIPLESH